MVYESRLEEENKSVEERASDFGRSTDQVSILRCHRENREVLKVPVDIDRAPIDLKGASHRRADFHELLELMGSISVGDLP